MHHFHYIGQNLYCEAVDLGAIAHLYGTPTYVYSSTTLAENYRQLTTSLPDLDLQICYAAKANSSLSILRHFANLGAAFDLVSGGELRRVIASGANLKKSVFAGVGKTEAEIQFALENGIFSFHVESEPELARLNHIAGKLGRRAPIALRINPDVDAQTHAKITTGKSDNKVGIPLKFAHAAFDAAAKYPNLVICGVQMHIGSQLTTLAPFLEATTKLVTLSQDLKNRHGITYLSLGGGLGIPYRDALASGQKSWWQNTPSDQRPPTPEDYGAILTPLLKPLGLKILLEPGRSLVGNAGILLSRVEHLKRTPNKNFLIIDAAMNDLLRPAMYDAYHEIVPLHRDTTRPALTTDIVGPICESSDRFAQDRPLQQLGEGEHLAILSTGAYGYTMASRYNSRNLPAEVLVHGSTFDLITARETFAQQIQNETIPSFLK